MTLRERLEAWIAENPDRAARLSYAAIAREMGGDQRTARKLAAKLLPRGDAYEIDWGASAYRFSVDRFCCRRKKARQGELSGLGRF